MEKPIAHLSVKDTINEAWKQSKNSKKPFLLVIAIYFFVQFFLEYANVFLPNHSKIIISILNHITSVFLLWSLVYLGLLCATGHKIILKDTKNIFKFKLMLRLYGTYFLSQLPLIAITLTLSFLVTVDYSDTVYYSLNLLIVFLIAFWLYLYIRLSLANGLIMLEGNSFLSAIKTSFLKTKNNFRKLLTLFILNLLTGILSALPILVSVHLIKNYGLIGVASLIPMSLGLVWSIPYLFVNYGVIYKKLSSLQPAHD